MKIFTYNNSTSIWDVIDTEVDAENNLLICKVSHFSTYTVAKQLQPDQTGQAISHSDSGSSDGKNGCFINTVLLQN
ncbi:MAG: hypothetical protein V1872_11780 [bacterium]